MKRLIAGSLCAGLILAGCAPQTPEPPKPAHEEKRAGETLQIDDLLQASKLVMTTKAGSDLPKTWKFEGDEAKAKASSLVPVLKEGQVLPTGEGRLVQSTVPMVSLILDVGTHKASITVYQDRYEFQGTWYQLENAPDRTYGAINKLEN